MNILRELEKTSMERDPFSAKNQTL